jgi:hypothetical protein
MRISKNFLTSLQKIYNLLRPIAAPFVVQRVARLVQEERSAGGQFCLSQAAFECLSAKHQARALQLLPHWSIK